MDIESIFAAGGVQILNPKWSKSKKNTQPKYITVTDLDRAIPNTNGMADAAYTAAATGNQDILGTAEELDKYKKYGITPNDFEDLYSQLIDKQSTWTKWGNAFAQTIVSEIGLGTAKGLSDLFDLIGQSTGISDHNYSNPVTQYLEEKQEEFRNFAPIYSDPNLNITNGGLLDAGWWASNMPSIVSSLTLLIPSTGIVKGASMLGRTAKISSFTRNGVRALTGANRAINAGKELNTFQRIANSASTANKVGLFLENGTTAALSRAMENYQEARQTYNDMYTEASETLKRMSDDEYNQVITQNEQMLKSKGINTADRDEVAKAIAQNAADTTFKLDWFNVGWDVLQMYGLRNAWKGIKNAPGSSAAIRRAQRDATKYFGKTEAEIAALKAKRKFGEKAKEWLGDKIYGSKLLIASEASEGAEEALNYGIIDHIMQGRNS